MKKQLLLGLLLVVVAAGVVYAVMTKLQSREPLPNGTVTLAGETTCLPVKNPTEPHILLCAIGLKTGDGKHYALQSQDLEIFETGKKIEVTGTLTSPDSENIYDITATMLVASFENK